MLTPQEISEKVFVKAVFGGYDMTGVDDFLETLSEDYSALYKDNAILKGKLKVLVEKVEEYRSTEDAMRMALVNAQKMGEEITIEANKRKEETLRNADEQANAKLSQITKLVSDEELKLQIASKETEKFIQLSQAIMHKHSDFLSKLETARRAVKPDAKPGVKSAKPSSAPAPLTAPLENTIVSNVADQVGSAVERLASETAPVSNLREVVSEADVKEALAQEVENAIAEELDENGEPLKIFGQENAPSISPRPRFDFDDLKFGANFDNR